MPIHIAKNEAPEEQSGDAVTSHETCHDDVTSNTTDEAIAELILKFAEYEVIEAYVPRKRRRSQAAERKAKSRKEQLAKGIRQFNAPVHEQHFQEVAEAVGALSAAGSGHRLVVVSEELAAVVKVLDAEVRRGKGVDAALHEVQKARRPALTEQEAAERRERRRCMEVGGRALKAEGWRRLLVDLALSLDKGMGSKKGGHPAAVVEASLPPQKASGNGQRPRRS